MRGRVLFGAVLVCAGAAFARTGHCMLARVSEADLQASQSVVRMNTDAAGFAAPSVWVQFYSSDFREAVRTLRASLRPLQQAHVQIESFYRSTSEARLAVKENGAVDAVLDALRENPKIKLVGRTRKVRISEMPSGGG